MFMFQVVSVPKSDAFKGKEHEWFQWQVQKILEPLANELAKKAPDSGRALELLNTVKNNLAKAYPNTTDEKAKAAISLIDGAIKAVNAKKPNFESASMNIGDVATWMKGQYSAQFPDEQIEYTNNPFFKMSDSWQGLAQYSQWVKSQLKGIEPGNTSSQKQEGIDKLYFNVGKLVELAGSFNDEQKSAESDAILSKAESLQSALFGNWIKRKTASAAEFKSSGTEKTDGGKLRIDAAKDTIEQIHNTVNALGPEVEDKGAQNAGTGAQAQAKYTWRCSEFGPYADKEFRLTVFEERGVHLLDAPAGINLYVNGKLYATDSKGNITLKLPAGTYDVEAPSDAKYQFEKSSITVEKAAAKKETNAEKKAKQTKKTTDAEKETGTKAEKTKKPAGAEKEAETKSGGEGAKKTGEAETAKSQLEGVTPKLVPLSSIEWLPAFAAKMKFDSGSVHSVGDLGGNSADPDAVRSWGASRQNNVARHSLGKMEEMGLITKEQVAGIKDWVNKKDAELTDSEKQRIAILKFFFEYCGTRGETYLDKLCEKLKGESAGDIVARMQKGDAKANAEGKASEAISNLLVQTNNKDIHTYSYADVVAARKILEDTYDRNALKPATMDGKEGEELHLINAYQKLNYLVENWNALSTDGKTKILDSFDKTDKILKEAQQELSQAGVANAGIALLMADTGKGSRSVWAMKTKDISKGVSIGQFEAGKSPADLLAENEAAETKNGFFKDFASLYADPDGKKLVDNVWGVAVSEFKLENTEANRQAFIEALCKVPDKVGDAVPEHAGRLNANDLAADMGFISIAYVRDGMAFMVNNDKLDAVHVANLINMHESMKDFGEFGTPIKTSVDALRASSVPAENAAGKGFMAWALTEGAVTDSLYGSMEKPSSQARYDFIKNELGSQSFETKEAAIAAVNELLDPVLTYMKANAAKQLASLDEKRTHEEFSHMLQYTTKPEFVNSLVELLKPDMELLKKDGKILASTDAREFAVQYFEAAVKVLASDEKDGAEKSREYVDKLKSGASFATFLVNGTDGKGVIETGIFRSNVKLRKEALGLIQNGTVKKPEFLPVVAEETAPAKEETPKDNAANQGGQASKEQAAPGFAASDYLTLKKVGEIKGKITAFDYNSKTKDYTHKWVTALDLNNSVGYATMFSSLATNLDGKKAEIEAKLGDKAADYKKLDAESQKNYIAAWYLDSSLGALGKSPSGQSKPLSELARSGASACNAPELIAGFLASDAKSHNTSNVSIYATVLAGMDSKNAPELKSGRQWSIEEKQKPQPVDENTNKQGALDEKGADALATRNAEIGKVLATPAVAVALATLPDADPAATVRDFLNNNANKGTPVTEQGVLGIIASFKEADKVKLN